MAMGQTANQLSTLRILWGGIFLAIVLFAAALRTLVPRSDNPEPFLLFVFAAVAVGLAIASFVLPPVLYRAAASRLSIPTEDSALPTSPDQLNATTRVLANPGAARTQAYRLFQAPFILSLSLSEAVALLGFVLGFLGFSTSAIAPFFLASVVLVAVRFPTDAAVMSRFERATSTRFPP